MQSKVAYGLLFALLPTLILSTPALGVENLSAVELTQPILSASSASDLNATALISAVPDQSLPTEPAGAATLLITTDVTTASRISAFTIASAINSLKLVEQAKTPKGARAVGKVMGKEKYGWGGAQFSCLDRLWTKESRWNYRSRNKITGAHGIPQAYPATKYESIGLDWRTNPITQMSWGLKYIKVRYETPCKALSTFYRIKMY